MRTIKLNTIFPEMITTRESLKLILPFLEKDQPTLLDFEKSHVNVRIETGESNRKG